MIWKNLEKDLNGFGEGSERHDIEVGIKKMELLYPEETRIWIKDK